MQFDLVSASDTNVGSSNTDNKMVEKSSAGTFIFKTPQQQQQQPPPLAVADTSPPALEPLTVVVKKKRQKQQNPRSSPPRPQIVVHKEDPRWIWVATFYGGFVAALLIAMLFVAGSHFEVIRITVPRGSGHKSSATFFYPVLVSPPENYDTTSAPLPLVNNAAVTRPLLSSLRSTFAHHHHAGYPCLCMHHLKVPGQQRYRVCAVYDAKMLEGMFVVINPRIIGNGNKTGVYEESSLSCPSASVSTARQRHHTIFLEWDTEGDVLYTVLHGIPAVCMQLALDEMQQGNKHCGGK
jgi:peptide deformylase